MTEKHPTIRLHLWLETDDGVFFGAGRAQLLEGIETHGSLKKAAEHLGMSYRAAWGKIKATEENIGAKLVIQNGGKKGGYNLTSEGRRLMRQYRTWFFGVEEYARHLANGVFSFNAKQFKKRP